MSKTLRNLIEREIALAETAIASDCDDKKQYEPMIENHRGQWLAYSKVGAILDCEEIAPCVPIRIEKNIKFTATWPAVFLTILCLISLF